MKTLIAILCLLTAITIKGKSADVIDYENNHDQYPTNNINKKDLPTKVLRYGASLPIAGAAYTADGLIYLTLGSVATVVSCWPLLAVALATNGYSAAAAPFCFHLTKAYGMVEEYHPHLGHHFWKETKKWREP